MHNYLDFEEDISQIEGKILELEKLKGENDAAEVEDAIRKLRKKADDALRLLYQNLTPWQKTQVARHPNRPPLS